MDEKQQLVAETRYVSNADGKGWLKVRWSDNSEFPPLPQHLAVELVRTAGGRDYFRRREGRMQQVEGSVVRKADGSSYLLETAPRRSAARLVFKRRSKQLIYPGGTLHTISELSPVALGVHDLEIPYEYHREYGSGYENQSIFAATWFRIGHSGDRFLHPGRISEGCITVTDVPAWTSLYNYLISARLDSRSVGRVEVVDG